jgi:signal transduction histidine kinase/ligand-binding sensor domain-containing protein
MVSKFDILFNLKNCLSIAFLLVSITGKPQNFIFKHLTTNEGLSSGNVWSIIQDKRGYLWFGTEDGLNKYDAYKFTVYRNDSMDTTSLSENWIQSIVEDSNALWICTRNGLNRYSYQSDNFKRYFNNDNDSNSISNSSLNNVIKDRKGQIWVGTNLGLSLYNRKKDKFIKYASLPENTQQTGSNQVRSITTDANDLFWLSTMNGIYQFDPSKNLFTRYLNDLIIKENLVSTMIHCIFFDTKQNIWIGTESDGLFYFSIALNKLYHFKNNPTDLSSLCSNQVTNIMEDMKGNVWITTNGGLSYIAHGTNMEQGAGIFINLRQDNKNGLSTNILNTTYIDKNNRLWIGGRFGNIDFIDNQDKHFLSLKFTDIGSSFSTNNMTAMAEDGDGNIWFGTDGGGIYFWDRKNNKYRVYNNYDFNKISLTSNKVIALCFDSYNNLWIGMWNSGIDKLDLEKNTFTHYRNNPYDTNSLASDNVFFIREDSEKNMWIGMWNGGLNLYDRKHDHFTRFPHGVGDSTVISGHIVSYIYEDRKKDIWIGSETNGLSLLNKKNYAFKKYQHNQNDNTSISSNNIYSIYEDTHNRLWIGTNGGLNLFERKQQTFRRFNTSDGLPNSLIYGILEDGNGNLWLSTNKGISKLTIKDNDSLILTFKNYDKLDGLQDNQFNRWSSLKTKQGELIFGGINGVSVFNPDSIRDNVSVPPIVITEFNLFNKPVPIGKPGSPLKMNISETKEITLSYKQSVISFEFAALDYTNPEKNRYAYKMEGFEKEWNYVGNQHKATYTNLDPGKYVFRVIGSNNDGVWNEKGVSLQIFISPPWWNTWWFKLLSIVVLSSMLASIFLLRIQRLKNQKILLENMVAIKTSELTELNVSKDKFFSIVAHDLKNPFQTILGYSEMQKEEIKSGDLAKIEEFAENINSAAFQTFRLLENLLDWANAQRGKIKFNPILINLSEILNEEFNVLNDMAVKKNIELKNSFTDNLTIIADKNMIKTILRNLISNAIKFTPRKGNVELNAFISNNQIIISVSDSGIGMTEETIGKLFRIDSNLSTRGTEDEKGTGLGLFLCKEFIEKHGGKIWVESESGKGSIFKFCLPLDINPSV